MAMDEDFNNWDCQYESKGVSLLFTHVNQIRENICMVYLTSE